MRAIDSFGAGKVALALGEVILIALGVWLAFAVEAWSDNRADRDLEERYLAGLFADFEWNASSLSEGEAQLSRSLTDIEKLFDRLQASTDPIPQDSAQLALASVYFSYFFTPRDATYSDLVASGNLSVIQNDSLRMLFGSWESRIEFHDWMKQKELDEISQAHTPFMIQHLPFSSVRDEYRGVRLVGTAVDLDPVMRRSEFERLMSLRQVNAADLRTALRQLASVASAIADEARSELIGRGFILPDDRS